MTETEAQWDPSVCKPWVVSSWLGFDTETTGISPKNDRVVTAATVSRVAAQENHIRDWLINPGVPIPERASAIHGITTEYARLHGQDPAEALDQINEVLANQMAKDQVIVVFNAGYDLPLLEVDSRRNGVRTLRERLGGEVIPVADPLVLDRAVDRYRRGKRTLSDMAQHYGIAVPDDTHQAHVDSILTLDVLQSILQKYPNLAAMDLQELHDFQRESHAAWAKDFQEYMAKNGRPTYISSTWF